LDQTFTTSESLDDIEKQWRIQTAAKKNQTFWTKDIFRTQCLEECFNKTPLSNFMLLQSISGEYELEIRRRDDHITFRITRWTLTDLFDELMHQWNSLPKKALSFAKQSAKLARKYGTELKEQTGPDRDGCYSIIFKNTQMICTGKTVEEIEDLWRTYLETTHCHTEKNDHRFIQAVTRSTYGGSLLVTFEQRGAVTLNLNGNKIRFLNTFDAGSFILEHPTKNQFLNTLQEII
jgi:hypothetical protein